MSFTKILDRSCKITYHACLKLIAWNEPAGSEIADLSHLVDSARSHETDSSTLADAALFHTHEDYDSLIRIIERIKYKCLKRVINISDRCRNLLNDSLKNIADIFTRLCGNAWRILRFDPDHIFDFILYTLWIRAGQIDLIYHRKDLEIMIKCKIEVC